ncbi:hypothetical protein Goarm_001096, partial [Gossypium armourianum]|nr:hypothetical protein [Gossypium armourianum]
MEAELANLNLKDEDEESFQFDKDPDRTKEDYQFCLVGKALTDCVVHFPSFKITLADLWHPLRGVSITDIWEKRYLLWFFYEVDIKRVLGVQDVKFDWDVSLKAQSRWEVFVGSKWLRDDDSEGSKEGGNPLGMDVDERRKKGYVGLETYGVLWSTRKTKKKGVMGFAKEVDKLSRVAMD